MAKTVLKLEEELQKKEKDLRQMQRERKHHQEFVRNFEVYSEETKEFIDQYVEIIKDLGKDIGKAKNEINSLRKRLGR